MVHDRRIDGKPFTFGNAGGLFMNAMTWWDHETESVWSQPWGRAIEGELRGVQLFLLPSRLVPFGEWRQEHPDGQVMMTGYNRFTLFRQEFDPDFVIGLLLAENAKAFYYRDVADVGVVNDHIGNIPIAVWAGDNSFHAYIRQVDERVVTLQIQHGAVVDVETGSTWDMTRGLATAGPLRGKALQPVPSASAYDWAWLDFYPDSALFEPDAN